MKFKFSKLFLTIVLIGILLFTLRPSIGDPDFWWHLKTGQVIVQTKQIPQFDSFSFTVNGHKWVTHEWLTEVIIYKLFTIGGFNLVIIFFSLLLLSAYSLTIFRCEDRTHLYTVGLALLLGVIMSTPVLWARPQVFTILYSSLFLLLLDLYIKRGKVIFLLPLPFIMLLWVNQHGAFIIGLVIIGVFVLGKLIDSIVIIISKKQFRLVIWDRKLIFLFGALFLSTSVTLINPSGSRILIYPFQTLSDTSMQRYIVEWASPDFSERTWIPLAVMFLSLLGFGLKFSHKISTTNVILCIIFGYMALSAIRHVALFSLVAIPILSSQLTEAFPKMDDSRQRGQLPTLFIFLVLCGMMFLLINTTLNLDEKQEIIIKNSYPVNAVNYLKENIPNAHVFNSYKWGGYLIWNFYPEQKVYIDGRADVYGGDFVAQHRDIILTMPGWKKMLGDKKIRLVLVEPDTPLAYALQISEEWVLLHEDDVSVLYQRK